MNKKIIQFPCDFQIKIIGNNTDSFEEEIITIVKKHFSETKDELIKKQLSENNNYLSLSVTIHVEDQAALDALYIELTAHPEAKWVL